MSYEEKKIAQGTKELNSNCITCGRARSRHTIYEATQCKKQEASGGAKKVVPFKVSHITSEYMQTTFRAWNDVNQGRKR